MWANHVHSHFSGENNHMAKPHRILGNVVSLRSKTPSYHLMCLLNNGLGVVMIGIQNRKKLRRMESSWGQEGFRDRKTKQSNSLIQQVLIVSSWTLPGRC